MKHYSVSISSVPGRAASEHRNAIARTSIDERVNEVRSVLLRILSIVVLLMGLLISGGTYAQQSTVAPCPPVLSIDGGVSSPPESCGSEQEPAPPADDTEYGPTQIVQGSCPRIPNTFPTVYKVRSEAEFDAAYSKVQPGEAIMLMDGTYDWDTMASLDKSGTATKPIYITYETLHGFVCNNCARRHSITGDYHTIAGLKFDSHAGENFTFLNGATGNRVACMNFTASADSDVKVATPTSNRPGITKLEIDNNVFDNSDAIPVDINDCAENNSWCTDSHQNHDFHIHHNTFKNKAYGSGNGNEAIKLGLGSDQWRDGTVKLYGHDRLDAVIENNLFDKWDGEVELISVKSSRNILRNNCVRGAAHGMFVIRSGDDNLLHGNWFESVSDGIRIAGARNYVLFNYFRTAAGDGSGVIHHPEIEWPDLPDNQLSYNVSKDGVFKFNVLTGMKYMVHTMHLYPTDGILNEKANGNVFQDNVYYSDSLVGDNENGSYLAAGGVQTEKEFKAANAWGSNKVFGTDLGSAACGSAPHFSGPGTSLMVPGTVLGGEQEVSAPTWW